MTEVDTKRKIDISGLSISLHKLFYYQHSISNWDCIKNEKAYFSWPHFSL